MHDRASGHVFVVNGELGAIAADARLVPSDHHHNVVESFQHIVSPHQAAATAWVDGLLVAPVDGTDAWLANIGRRSGSDPARLHQAVDDFADAVLDRWESDRRRPVVCVPVLGTRYGGHGVDKAPAIRTVLQAVHDCVARRPIDVVLVCFESTMYSAVQRARRGLASTESPTWELGDDDGELHNLARQLGTAAREHRLTLFMGAGTSVGAGLPSWRDLLRQLAERVGVTPEELGALERLDHRDQAAILERRFDERSDVAFADAVAELTSAGRCSLTHVLLASLHCREAVTTNYDRLYEIAVKSTGRTVAVLPYETVDEGASWLLKLHGCVDHRDSIVLTRRDYLGVPSTRGALFGLVQAMLMTRQMLFVGYSLGDEDFHQLIEEVRHARTDAGSDRPGLDATVVTLFRDDLFAELWAADLRTVPMSPHAEDERSDTYEAARTLQIMLDLAAYEAADATAFLLEPSYSSLLDDVEEIAADLLKKLRGLDIPQDHPLRGWIDRTLHEMTTNARGSLDAPDDS